MSNYSLLLPGSSTSPQKNRLASTEAFTQWIERDDGTELTEKPKGAVAASYVDLVEHHPTTITQKLIFDCRKLQRAAELNRPSCLSPAYLTGRGYDVSLGDQDPSNLAIISAVIQDNLIEFEVFVAKRLEGSLKVVEMLYPDANFSLWREITIEDSPVDVETLTNFAVAQVDAFLGSSPGLLTPVLLSTSELVI